MLIAIPLDYNVQVLSTLTLYLDYNVPVCKPSLQCSSVQTLTLQGCQQEISVHLQGLYGSFCVHLCQMSHASYAIQGRAHN